MEPLSAEALRGLAFLHSRGLVHGALVPASIVVTGPGPKKTAKVRDHGLAAMGRSSLLD